MMREWGNEDGRKIEKILKYEGAKKERLVLKIFDDNHWSFHG